MTLLFMDGFDSANVLPKPEWDTAALFIAATGRRGEASGAAGMGTGTAKVLTLPSAAATCFIGFATLLSSSTTFGSTSAALAKLRIGATTHLVLNVDSAGKLILRLSAGNGTVLATSAGPPIAVNTWVHIQAKVTIHNTAGSCEVRQDLVPVINYTGQTGTAAGAVTAVEIATAGSGSSISWDDMWLCDAVDATAPQGRAFNDFLGDVKVVSLIPTADTASAQWTPSTGTNHAATVDETPPNTTDYVSTPTVGNRDLYDVTDLPANTTGVLAYRVGVYAQKSDAGAMSVKPVVKDPAGTVAQTAIALSTSWAPGYGPLTTKKTDGSLPTVADMNATQVGIDAA